LDNKKCLNFIEAFAEEQLSADSICALQYHNIEHTRRVVKNAELIGNIENVTEDQMFILKAIAWFHDLGYSNCYDGHEDVSMELAKEFLTKLEVDNKIIEEIIQGINATRVPQKATTQIEKIIADADLFDLGTDDYFLLSEKLFDEWNDCIEELSKDKLWRISLDFLKSHQYFTDYGREVLELKKQENMQSLKKILNEK
jgi:predicted metal-dependent HD superfamily phosphohydrolase